jgi:hypothetical protein
MNTHSPFAMSAAHPLFFKNKECGTGQCQHGLWKTNCTSAAGGVARANSQSPIDKNKYTSCSKQQKKKKAIANAHQPTHNNQGTPPGALWLLSTGMRLS